MKFKWKFCFENREFTVIARDAGRLKLYVVEKHVVIVTPVFPVAETLNYIKFSLSARDVLY